MLHHTIQEADEDRMSNQEETEEENVKIKRKGNVKMVLQWWPVAVKFLELCISILCIAMIVDPIRTSSVGTRYLYQLLLIFSTYGGFLISLAILLLSRLFGDRLPYKTSALFSIIGAFLNLATGCLILVDRIEFSTKYIFYPNMYMLDMMCISGVFALVNMFVFMFDAAFTIKLQSDF